MWSFHPARVECTTNGDLNEMICLIIGYEEKYDMKAGKIKTFTFFKRIVGVCNWWKKIRSDRNIVHSRHVDDSIKAVENKATFTIQKMR